MELAGPIQYNANKFFSLGLYLWFTWNLNDPNIGNGSINCQVLFGVAVYELWKDRNNLVFSRRTQLDRDLHYLIGHQVCFTTSHITDPVFSLSQGMK